MIPIKKEGVVVNKVGEEYFLLPESSDEKRGVYLVTLDEIGYYIYNLIDGKRSEQDIANGVCEEYEGDSILIKNDVTKLIKFLIEKNMIIEKA